MPDLTFWEWLFVAKIAIDLCASGFEYVLEGRKAAGIDNGPGLVTARLVLHALALNLNQLARPKPPPSP